jgi:hypothetical protein
VVGDIFLGNKMVSEKMVKQVHRINRNEREQEKILSFGPKFLLFRNNMS